MKRLKLTPVIFAALLVLTSLGGCGRSKIIPSKRITGDGSGKSHTPKEKTPTTPFISCEQQWNNYSQLHPQGRQTSYQEVQTMTINGTVTTLAESVIHKVITENSEDKVSWTKEIDELTPEVGRSVTQASLTKITFMDLCSKGVNLIYSERPANLAPNLKEEVKILFQGIEVEVMHERYILTKGTLPSDKDELNIWIGHKPPHQNLLFKKQRKFFRMSPSLSENRIEKILQEIKD